MVRRARQNIFLSIRAQHLGPEFRGLSCGLKFGHGWPKVRTLVAQSSDAGGPKSGRGWPEIRAAEPVFQALKIRPRFYKPRIFKRTDHGGSGKIFGNCFRGLGFRPGEGALEKKRRLHFVQRKDLKPVIVWPSYGRLTRSVVLQCAWTLFYNNGFSASRPRGTTSVDLR